MLTNKEKIIMAAIHNADCFA